MKIKDLTLEDCKVICKNFKKEHRGNCAFFNGHEYEYECPLNGICESFPNIGRQELNKEIERS